MTQYACDYNNLAPTGCTQWFFGATSASVQTYNFAGGQHLANQKQNICVRFVSQIALLNFLVLQFTLFRKERGMCKICWTAATITDFVVSGKTNALSGKVGVS
jgi:hypothetical protein